MNLLCSVKDELTMESNPVNKRLLQSINSLRNNPECFVPLLSKRKNQYQKTQNSTTGIKETPEHEPQGNKQSKILLFSPNHPQKAINTSEGSKPISTLMGELYGCERLPLLNEIHYLSEACQYIADEFSTYEDLDEIHLNLPLRNFLRKTINQSERVNFLDRVNCMINISFTDKEMREPIIGMLIDDGNSNRTNQKLLLDRNQRYVGIGCRRIVSCQELMVTVLLLTTKVSLKE